MKINKLNLTILSSLTKYLSILLCLILILNPTNSYSSSIDFDGVASFNTLAGGEKYIRYNKGGIESFFYTNYLPPKDSYNNNVATEHPLEKCRVYNQQTINMIGLDCMIAIPPPCPSPIVDDTRCLTYANVFEDVGSKKLRPKPCIGSGDRISCLSTDKPYCHLIDDPMLGWNCKLASCNLLPNHVFRRPGVNCMADCNQAPGNSIYDATYFMEGFNCLQSCSTTASPIPGHNCVFEFNNYVMPLCSNPRISGVQAARSYNISNKTPNQIREDCLDLRDLPLCVAGESDISKKCVNRCSSDNDPNYDLTCVKPSDVNSFCHYNSSNPNCKKYYCKLLSPKELKFSNNAISPAQNESDQAGCFTSDYLDFSYYQLFSEGHNNYKTNYTLAKIPCQSSDYLDTETIVKVLGSQYYESGLSGNYPYLQKIIDNIISLNGQDTPQIRELHTPTHNNFAQSTIFDRSSFCKFTNVSQKIECDEYNRSKSAPNDCNSNGFAPTGGPACVSNNCFCNVTGQLYCYKTGINCNKSTNQIYPVCKNLNTTASIPDPDTSVSWFFKPALDPLAIKEIGGVRKLISFDNSDNYHPLMADTSLILNKSDNIEMSTNTLENNFSNVIGIIWTSTSPGIEGANLGQSPISPEYMCGMNNNINQTPSEDSLYYKNNVHSYYGLDEKIIHKFEVCARFMSTGAIANESCGTRRCRANCSALGSPFQICTKNCGVDICKEIQVITDESGAMTEHCVSDEKSFKENYVSIPKQNCRNRNPAYCLEKKFPKCAVKLSSNGDALENVRIRSYIPDPSSNYICSVLEFQGVTTRHLGNNYFDGDEFFIVPTGQYKNFTETVAGTQVIKTKTLFRKICVSGTYDSSTGSCTNGFDTNSQDIDTDVWRTSRIVRHILQPPNSSGGWDMSVTRDGTAGNLFYLNDDGENYLDQFGSPNESTRSRDDLKPNMSIHRIDFNKKIKYETSDCIKFSLRYSSPIYNNVETRRTAPSLFIPNLLIDGICNTTGGSAGTIVCDASLDTDFYTPGIKIVWGNKSASFPLQNDPTSVTNYKIIKINANSEQSADYKIYLRNTGLTDYTGMEKTVYLKKSFDIEKNPNVCLYEKEGSGSSATESLIGCAPRRRAVSAVIESMTPGTSPSETLYNQTNFQVKFYNPSYVGLAYNNIEILKLTDLEDVTKLKKCLGNISNQGYPMCIERNECTILNFECIENERDLIAELSKNPRSEIVIANMRVVSKYCNEILLPKCNALKGIDFTTTNSRLNTSIVNGFNAPANGNYYGWHNEACIVSGIDKLDDPASKKYVIENIPTDPSFRGKCFGHPTCTLYNFSDSQSLSLGENQRIRLATPKEMGLCFEYTKFLQSCPPITYITTPNPNKSDPYYTLYLDTPHNSHLLRYAGHQFNGQTYNAEFDIAFIGNSIEGKCVGFYQQNGSIVPTAQCTATGWGNFQNNCIRYSCPSLTVSPNGADDLGEYANAYDPPKTFKSLIGMVHGYASWNREDINGTAKQNGTFVSCNIGFRKADSTPIYIPMNSRDGTPQLISKINSLTSSPSDVATKHKIMSIFGKISPTSYSDGTTPSRKCNQLGVWEQVNNPCQRIKCPAINFENPVDAGAYNLDDFRVTFEDTANNLTIRTSEYSVTSPTQKISFTATENYLNKNKIEVIFTLTQTRYLLYLANGTQNFINIVKGKSYAFKFEDGKYKQLDTSKDGPLKELWAKAGGASFPEGNARRSKNFLYIPNALDDNDQHMVYGTCNSDLGYLSLGTNPSMICDHLGNWTNIQNQCVSDCSAVSGTVGNDRGHGFATWAKSSPKIGESIVSTATSCIGLNSIAYPYQPLNDNEGTKKDYGIGNTDIGLTVDNFDSIIESDNGADYTVSASTPIQAPSDDNQQGKEFSFKIQQNFGSSSSFASGNSSDNLITLFNTNTLTLNAPTNTIWSKITFASYGTPDYSNQDNLRIDSTNNCHFLYSKLVLALKCIGKTTCNISLSDFINYDSYMPATCQQNLGNGLNGSDSSIQDIGGTGGGGGGNSNAQGGSITTSVAGGVSTFSLSPSQNGKSYCDQNIHLTVCEVSLGTNAGRSVNITENDTGLFDGQSGSAIVKVAPADNTPDASKTVYNYSTPGVYTITIPTLASVIGKTDIYFYVDYDIIGGGGGGGGEGIAPGTNGNSGSRVRGKFRIEAGKSFKVHIGGGGKAGKTGCFGSSPPAGAVSKLEDKYLPNKKFAIAKNQNFAQKSEGKTYDKIFAKNSQRQIFDDKVYYQDFVKNNSKKNYKKTSKINNLKYFFELTKYSFKSLLIKKSYAGTCGGWENGTVFNYGCASYQYGGITETCDCPANGYADFYTDGNAGGTKVTYGIGDHNLCKWGYSDTFSSMYAYGSVNVYVDKGCRWSSGEGLFGPYVGGGNYYGYSDYFNKYGYNDAVSYIYVQDTRSCDWTRTGGCYWNNCYTPDALGISSAWGYYGSGTSNCNKSNSSGTFDWNCPSNGGAVSISRNGCYCNTGYRADGNNCTINICNAGAAQGYDGSRTYSGASGTISCNKPNFDTTKTLSFPACDSNGATKTTSSAASTCTCNTGYTLSGTGTSATCNQNCNLKDSSTTYTLANNYGFTISSTNTTILAGNGGTTSIACFGTGYATSNATLTCNSGALSLTTSCACASGYHKISDKCVQATCTLPAQTGYAGETISSSSLTTGSFSRACQNNYTGTLNFTCTYPVTATTQTATLSSGSCSCPAGYYTAGTGLSQTCNRIKCTAPAQAGYSGSTTIDYNTLTTAVNCNGTNFNTSNQLSFSACTTNGSNLTVSSGSCGCATGYYLSGSGASATCNRIKCTISDTDGYSGSTTIDYSGASDVLVNCDKTNYNSTNQLTYNPCTTNGTTITFKSGTCNCAANYFKNTGATPADNTCISNCTMTTNDFIKWGFPSSTSTSLIASSTSIGCDTTRGYSNSRTGQVSCAVSGSSTTYSLTTNCNCATGYAHSNDANHTVPSSSVWEKANSCFKECPVTAPVSAGYGTGTSQYNALEGTNTKTCFGTGYSTTDTATISCSSVGVASITDPCNCSTNYTKSTVTNHTPPANTSSITYATGSNGTCYRQCSVTAPESAGYGTGNTAYTALEGTNTKTCFGTGYLTTDTSTISCNASGVASVSDPCSCANSTFAKSTGLSFTHTPPTSTSSITYAQGANGTCFKKCNISAGNARGWGVGSSAFDILEGTNSINCSGTRYATPSPANKFQISCSSGATAEATAVNASNSSIIQGCPCATGYSKSSGSPHTAPANITTAGSEINFYYSTANAGQTIMGTCFKECSVSATQSNDWGTGTTAYTVLEGTNTKACTSNGFISGTNITINCNSSGTATATACSKIGCPASFTLEGIVSPLTGKTGQNTQTCDANGYSGNISYFCSTSGSSASYTVTTPCSEYACAGSLSVPGIGSVSGGTGANELNCLSSLGYSGTYKYYCNALGSHINVQSCTANVCNLNPDSDSGIHGIGFLARTGLSASGTIDCDANGYSGTKTYTCTSNSTVTSTGRCYANTCNNFTNRGVTETITGKSGVTSTACTKPGYSGTLEFYCKDDGSAQITSECTENTCNVLSGIGYNGKNNQKVSGSYACNEGYYGTVNWVCGTGNANATVTHNCTRITCNPPASANASLSTLDYTGSTWTNYSCKTGFKANFDIISNSYQTPQYKCETDLDGANPSVISIQNACIEVTCNIPGYGIIGYNGGNRHTISCNPNNGLMGTAILVCDEFGTVSFIQSCDTITCNLPACSSGNCPANVQNTLEDGSRINFNNFFSDLNCKASHYFDNCPEGVTSNCGRPKVRCKYDPVITTTPSAGVPEFMGIPCQQTTCTANNELNSVIDSTSVNWTGDTYVTTSCKNGYYMQSPSLPPKYNCTGSGSSANYNYLNRCLAITCSAPANSFGINSDALLSWGSGVQVPCNKTGYTGDFTYNCTGLTNPGTITITNNSCIVRSCNLPSNNPATYATFVANGQNLGGIGGKILSSSVYFKGGNGGRSSDTFTTGAGGGGGSASFIENSDGRIIVIAGGGGGGNGGGSTPINPTLQNISPIADSKLFTNMLGSYLIAKIQTLPIQNSDASKTGGLIYGLSDASNSFSLNAPAGMFVSDIFFSSLGNPITSPANPISPYSIPSPFNVKYNTCHSPNSFRFAEINCQGRDSCYQRDINDLEFGTTCTPTLSTKSWAVVAGYSYKEPSINVNGVTKNVKEINLSTMTFGPAILENNKVYNFIDFGTFWIKYAYWDDEFIIKTSATINAVDKPLKIKFHRSNNTLEPKLKITQISGSSSTDLTSFYKIKKIVNEAPSPISVGYIKENIYYILRLNISNPAEPFWEIREYTDRNADVAVSPELPKRTCMTTQLSENGMLGTIWSPTNSICINKCPGYDPATKVGDDRIGAGATLHYTSTLPDGGIVYWPETNFGSKARIILTTGSPATETGLAYKGYSVYQEYNGSTNAKQFEKEQGSQLGGGIFILERECGLNGVWMDPKPLCATGGGKETDPPSGNFNDTRVYLDHSSYSNGSGDQKYIRADSEDQSIGECLSGYYRITSATHGIYQKSTADQYNGKLTFACKSQSVNGKRYEDLSYLDVKSGSDCIKYCKMENLSVGTGVEKRGQLIDGSFSYNDQSLLLPGKSIDLDCKSTHTYAQTFVRPNYLYNEINRLHKNYHIDWDRCDFNLWAEYGEVNPNVATATDISISSIEEKHINCMDKLIFMRYWTIDPNYDLIYNPNSAMVTVGGVQYERFNDYFYKKNPMVHKNVRQYFDEDVILIARKKTEKRIVALDPTRPRFECISSGKDSAVWSSVSEPTNCRYADKCIITKYHGIRHGARASSISKIAKLTMWNTTSNEDSVDSRWFPLRSFIYQAETNVCGQDICLNNGQTINTGANPECDTNKYGRCAFYVGWSKSSGGLLTNNNWSYWRKYLKSASCNDGDLTVEWDFDDVNSRKSCDGSDGYSGTDLAYIDYINEDEKPLEKYIGGETSSITDAQSKIITTNLACPVPQEENNDPLIGS